MPGGQDNVLSDDAGGAKTFVAAIQHHDGIGGELRGEPGRPNQGKCRAVAIKPKKRLNHGPHLGRPGG